MVAERERQGFRDWLRTKGIPELPDAEVDRFTRSSRKQMYLWGIVIIGLLIGCASALGRFVNGLR